MASQLTTLQRSSLYTITIIVPGPAGKSTLVNRLLGTKISGVSSKRNTTITPQLGCFTSGAAQVLLYDTPGLVEHSVQGSPLERLRSAWATAAMADQLLFIVDAERQVRLRCIKYKLGRMQLCRMCRRWMCLDG